MKVTLTHCNPDVTDSVNSGDVFHIQQLFRSRSLTLGASKLRLISHISLFDELFASSVIVL